MIGLVKAILIGIVLTAGFLLIPVFMAILIPLASFAAVVLGVWFLLQILREDDDTGSSP